MFLKLLRISALSFLFFSHLSYSLEPVYSSFFGKVAINGYDPVAYFTDGAAFKGNKDFEYEWKGAKWRFVSEKNKNKFVLDPEAYEPQFGGYCSYAVSLGATASSDPNQFTISDGKLYLNYSSKTKILWEDDRESKILQGNANWPKLISGD